MIPELSADEKLIFSPKRFIIITVLYTHGEMIMSKLQKLTELTWGDLASNINIMEKHDLVKTRKALTIEGPRTKISLTEKGVKTYESLASKLEQLLEQLDNQLRTEP